MISRRSLFALFGGAVAAPLAKVLPAAPIDDGVVYWHQPEIVSRAWEWKTIATGQTFNTTDIIAEDNALIALIEKKLREAEIRIVRDFETELYG